MSGVHTTNAGGGGIITPNGDDGTGDPGDNDGFSSEAPLLENVRIGLSGTATDVTVSFWNFSVFFVHERMTPAIAEVRNHHGGILVQMLAGLPVTVVWLLTLIWARWYYNRYGVVPYVHRMKQIFWWYPHMILVYDLSLGRYHEVTGDFEYAIESYEGIFERFPFLKERKGGVCIYKALGNICYRTHRYRDALTHLQKAHQLRMLKDEKALAWQLKNDHHAIGATYRALGRHQDALEAYRQSVESLNLNGWDQTTDMAQSIAKVGESLEILAGEDGDDAENDDAIQQAATAYREALRIHLLNEGEFPRTKAVACLHDKLGDLVFRHPHLRTPDEEGEEETTTPHNNDHQHHPREEETATGHWNVALEVYRRNGKTDGDPVIIGLQTKLRDALNAEIV